MATAAETKCKPEDLAAVAERYTPKPIDLSKVSMPTELEHLTETLAENAHDEWARQRIKDGWTFGEQRNDELRHHPCLVPYDYLTETEKEYDRLTAMNTLRLLIGLGFKIERKD